MNTNFKNAPWSPGISGKYASSVKPAIEKSPAINNQLSFTMSHGMLHALYFLREVNAGLRDLEFLWAIVRETDRSDTGFRIHFLAIPDKSLSGKKPLLFFWEASPTLGKQERCYRCSLNERNARLRHDFSFNICL